MRTKKGNDEQMSTYTEKLTPKEWDDFCANMLRYHYKAKNFWEVSVPVEPRASFARS